MVATLLLLGCALSPAQPANRLTPPTRAADWVLSPRLARGQELVYRGSYVEEATGARVRFHRGYRVELRYFVLDTPARGSELAGLTVLQDRAAASSGRVEPVAAAVRLERLFLGFQGKVTSPAALSVPLDGAPTLEVGAFVELPRTRLAVNSGWEVLEEGRPPLAWRVAGTESVNGQPCVKLIGVQQSDDWGRPRGDRHAWRRQDTVWVSPRTGIPAKVERVIEQCEPARREVAQRGVLRYELESSMRCPAQVAADRRLEITQTLAFRDAAASLMHEPTRNTRQLKALARRVGSHLDSQPPTPYRQAVLLLKRQLEAAARGEVVAVTHEAASPAAATARVAAVGAAAPDFLTSEITGTGSARLSKWKGKPVVLVFYHPASSTAADLLRFAQELHTGYGRHATIVGLSVGDDAAAVLKQRTALGLSFSIAHGAGMRVSYGVEATPKVVVIDGAGIVRGQYLGWGSETADEVLGELRRWLPGR